ncbi:hypothetical protein SAMN05216323_103544 [Williamwhitmania taraxaci]|uniref:Uncharacterized protein n=2 Tax=Williamwhitmania taraxaci TaxID=1640674 RepID=A0A1G6MEQ1_9BACT|nr:hypothetical protein SAMN05216323_103544 [Williamwhitmania taraxaci]
MPTEDDFRMNRVSQAEDNLRMKINNEYVQFVQERLHRKRMLRRELAGIAIVGVMLGVLVWCGLAFGLFNN